MPAFTYVHRVRYRECDPMGYVYHAHYADYFEYARTEALREMGLAYKTLEDRGLIMPVVELAIQYRKPAYYDDLLAVTARFDTLPRLRVPIAYDVRRGDDVIVTGHVTLCFFDPARQRPVPPPPDVLALFEAALAGA